jgi:hypothetical protein
MTEHGKTLTTWTSLALLAVLGLSLSCDARAETTRGEHRTQAQIEACVAELGKHADYANATRVVHVVDKLNQRSLVELEIGISTSLFNKDGETIGRAYRTSCTTGHFGDIVKLRVNLTEPQDEAHQLKHLAAATGS